MIHPHGPRAFWGACCLLGGLLAITPLSARAQTPAVTLEEALRLAQRVAPGVVQAQGGVRNADAAVRSAKGAYLPSLNASSSGSRSYSEGPSRINSVTGEVESGNSATTNVSMGLNASVDLFTGFRRGADSRAARASRDAAEAGLTDAQFQTGLTVTGQFFDALAAQQLVRVREASVRRAEEQLNLAVAKLHVGSATRSDSLRSVVNLGSAQLALVSAESDVTGRQASLGRSIGYDGGVAAADDSAFYTFVAALDTAALQQEALQHSPTVQAAVANEGAARASLSSARAGYFPTLSLGGSASWNGTSSRDYQLFGQRAVSLGLSWPIFTRFQREQTIATRVSSLDAAEASAKDSRRQIQAALATQVAALDAARVKIDISRTSVAAATEDLRVVNERYRVGAATILDILNSQEALAQAEVDAITARFDYLKAKAQIEALIGRHL
jgi:outer membrane protein TolC